MVVIDTVQFDVLSPKQIRHLSVCEITTDELYEDNRPKLNGLRDPRLGVSSRLGRCASCNQTWSKCSGHFGHYELPHPVYNIGWIPEVLQWLRHSCRHCGHVSATVLGKKCPTCKKPCPKYMKANAVTLRITEHDAPTRDLLAPEAHQYLEQIPKENVHIFRGRKDDFHPSSLVMTVLPIPPNCVRPSPTIDGDEVRGEDDLTRRLLYILRVAKGYAKVQNEASVIREHALRRTQDAVHMYIDQKRMSSKQISSQKSIASRLRGKTGRLRGTLMGKRSNFTARTVITGDSMLDMREVGVPQHVADTLTIVEHVNRLNYKHLRELVRTQDKTIKYVIRPDGTRLDMRTIKGRIEQLKQGWSVERTMRNGDPVLFNRQPSLHRMSIMCHRARIMPVGKTFRLNLSCTTPYNADFDGDEMNLHLLQSHESRADALELMSVAKNIITPQANRPVMGIVQDSLLSSFMMTQPDVTLDKAEMCNIVMWVEGAELPPPDLPGPLWTGLQCMSLLFPKDFQWRDMIVDGILVKGPLGKKALGRSHGSIIHRLYNDYGPDRCCQFINELQRINHLWFSTQGFSIGIGDMRISKQTAERVRQECADVDEKAEQLRKQYGDDAEGNINRMLNQTRDSMGLIAQSSMSKDNCLGLMVKSGSKGSMVNILQIMACVGQQNCSGKRMQPTLSGRTLPMFRPSDVSTRSRGFVKHSYIDGLQPDEYWHHTVGGREGLIDTAVKTSTTGYIQRRLVKSLESVHVANDKTVRDSQGRVIQFRYGEDGIDGMCHEMVESPFDDMDELPNHYYSWPCVLQSFHLWKYALKTRLGDKWAISVPVQRIVNTKKDGGHVNEKQCRDIIQPLLDATQHIPLVKAYILSILAIETLPCSAKNLKDIIKILMQKWHASIVAPGEMVGTIAAQSVGEPTTQMTLNTFHNAGNSAKNVTLGVPRFEELINASTKMKTPVLTVFSKDANINPETAWKLKTEIKRLRLIDCCLEHSFEPKEFPGLEEYLKCPDNQRWSTKKEPKRVLHCILDRKKMTQSSTDVYELVNELRKRPFHKHIALAYSDNPTGNVNLYMRTRHGKQFFQYAKQILDTTIKGSSNIPEVKIRREGKRFVIDTEGIDLYHVQSIRGLDKNHIQCNDIFEIRNKYGIEAARATLLREMHAVLSFDGSYVNMRHIMTIADWMTWGGNICALTRHGVKKMMENATPLKRATFEQPVEIFHHAAVKGLHDELTGVSEQLLVGKEPRCGSHFNGTVTESSYQTKWDKETWESSDEEMEDAFDYEGVDNWMPQPAPIDSSWDTHTTFASNTDYWQESKPLYEQRQQPAWAQPQQPAWAQPQQPAWAQPQQPRESHTNSPGYNPVSPGYNPVSPGYNPVSPDYNPVSPDYNPNSPQVTNSSALPQPQSSYSPTSPAYSPTSPAYSPTSPAYSPTSPDNSGKPAYSPTSPAYSPTSPAYSPTSPAYSPTSPQTSKTNTTCDFYEPDGNESPIKRRK